MRVPFGKPSSRTPTPHRRRSRQAREWACRPCRAFYHLARVLVDFKQLEEHLARTAKRHTEHSRKRDRDASERLDRVGHDRRVDIRVGRRDPCKRKHACDQRKRKDVKRARDKTVTLHSGPPSSHASRVLRCRHAFPCAPPHRATPPRHRPQRAHLRRESRRTHRHRA